MTEATSEGGRLVWQEATVTRVVEQTPTVKSFFLKPPQWSGFDAGQHVDVRLTAPDGYRAERSYSIASSPGEPSLELAIERLAEGEVSPFFHEVVEVGDTIELRGPIGGHFVWRPSDRGPVLLVGGGSGVAPLMSMLRDRARRAPAERMVLVYSARRWSDVMFREELEQRAEAEDELALFVTLSRESVPPSGYRRGRIDRTLVGEALAALGAPPRLVFVCGATAFVDVAAMLLIEAGVPFGRIRTERYGGSPPPSLDGVSEAPEG